MKLAGGSADFAALPTGGADLKPFAKEESSYLQYSSGSTRFPKGIDIPQSVLLANTSSIANYGLQVRGGRPLLVLAALLS